MKNDPKVYYIEFSYDGVKYTIHPLSYWDLSKGTLGDKLILAELIEGFIKDNNLHKEGAKVSEAKLFGKGGETIVKIEDFAKLYEDEKEA